MRLSQRALALCVFVLAAACDTPKPDAEAPPTPPPMPEPVAAPTPPDCLGPVATSEPKTLTLAGKTWVLNGSTLTLQGAQDSVSIGALTDIKENSPENLQNISQFVDWFKAQKVDAVVVAGDTGMDRAQIADALVALAKVEVPVLVIIGNREGRDDYNAALTEVSAKHANVFNLNTVRRVDTPAVDLVSMPGYFNPNYMHAENGCVYQAKDVDGLAAVLQSCNSPALLVSHGGPKQSGELALDRTAEGENVGDPALAAVLQKGNVPFGIFGNIHEAGGRATDATGATVLPPDQPHPALYLNPGPADGVRWMMNDKTESIGMAAVMSVKEGKASYTVKRIQDAPAGKRGAP